MDAVIKILTDAKEQREDRLYKLYTDFDGVTPKITEKLEAEIEQLEKAIEIINKNT